MYRQVVPVPAPHRSVALGGTLDVFLPEAGPWLAFALLLAGAAVAALVGLALVGSDEQDPREVRAKLQRRAAGQRKRPAETESQLTALRGQATEA